MRVIPYIALLAFAAFSFSAGIVRAQFNPIDQTRSVTLKANTNIDGPGFETNTDTEPSPVTNTSPGPWSISQSGEVYSYEDSDPEDSTFASNAGSQTSDVASSGFNYTDAVSINAAPYAYEEGDDNADSYYKVDFSVSAPTGFQLTAQYSTGGYGEGEEGTLTAYVTLSESGAGNLFSLGVMNEPGAGDFGAEYFGGPTSFDTILEPGNTYTLTADDYIDRPIDTETAATENGAVSFTAGVPEPASLGILTAIGLAALTRRR
jgi:hypothetical protein